MDLSFKVDVDKKRISCINAEWKISLCMFAFPLWWSSQVKCMFK